ncbi:hypothetical protein [Streptomyces cavourensis]|uniref:Uncharacterized protein n=1 Tax=Streptomyces cavourensis TaxID=67258 RepID=A0ABY5FIP9_9ACTN|nr:hypothetical protein [Streptomyces cavourensis]UTR83685.1 hypothetical protein NLU04_34815 [Streptomyces cavourensis]
MAADLYTRYMAASDQWRAHRKGCPPCTDGRSRCADGTGLWERFCRLQDAYLTHLRTR